MSPPVLMADISNQSLHGRHCYSFAALFCNKLRGSCKFLKIAPRHYLLSKKPRICCICHIHDYIIRFEPSELSHNLDMLSLLDRRLPQLRAGSDRGYQHLQHLHPRNRHSIQTVLPQRQQPCGLPGASRFTRFPLASKEAFIRNHFKVYGLGI